MPTSARKKSARRCGAPKTPAKPGSPTLDTIAVFNPATGEEVGAVPATPPEGVAEAVARARAAQRRWAERSFAERVAVVRRFHDALLLGIVSGARTTTASLGLVCDQAKSQVPALGYTVTYAVGNTLLTIWGMVIIILLT